jgi:putative endonuclease
VATAVALRGPKNKNMHFVVYVLESADDKSWYIGFTTNLKQRLNDHNQGKSTYTSKKSNWRLIYAEMYLNKLDALGREKFLKSGSGHTFIKKQLKNFLAN